jgi:hypothetical protein
MGLPMDSLRSALRWRFVSGGFLGNLKKKAVSG